jgi:AraC-like DNA-binding protein/quercetin dioxygenase-like cupin family protein
MAAGAAAAVPRRIVVVGDLQRQGVLAGTVIYPPRGRYGPRLHPWCQLLFLISGEVLITADQRPLRLAAGEVALLAPGHRYFLQFAADRESRHRWLTVDQHLVPPAQLAALRNAPASLPTSAAMASLMDAALMLPHSVAQDSLPQTLASLAAMALLLYVEEARARGLLDLPSQRASAEHPAVTAARDLVRRRLHEPITLAMMAGAGHVAPDYLTRLFRQHLGTTPVRYLWAERVRLAVELLEHTGLPVAEVAARAGFQTPQHCARLVRAATGLPPGRLRRQHWGTA